jgi:O-antigen ligase
MTLAPIWRTRIYATGGALLAIWSGFAIAQQEFFWPFLLAGITGGLLLIRLQPLPIGTAVLGFALVGYIVGNRGFAQLYLANALPLLPAELVLLIGATVLAVQSAFRRELPFRRDGLNLGILFWMIVGVGRLLLDLRLYGFNALRDFALVYYAAFFFLAQDAAKNPAARRYLINCLLIGCVALAVAQIPYREFPDFFLERLTVRGVPFIYYKGDLIGIFMAVGAVLFFLRWEERRRISSLLISLGLIAATLATNNRASMLSLGVATLLLAAGGRWRFSFVQGGVGIFAVVVILLAADVSDSAWQNTPLYGFYERIVSITDPLGQNSYSGEDTSYKGDNNLFRSVWWRNVFDETVEENPYLGLGFGHDLADRFVREYFPDSAEEFSTRSPHNVLLTIFARMGLLGLIPFLVIVGSLARRSYRAVRANSLTPMGLWCGCWIILISACFGVVLEGPMGAVVFWTMLGLAHATSDSPAIAAETAPIAAAALQPAEQADEVGASS